MLRRFSVCGFRNFADRVTIDLADTRDYRFNTQAIRKGLVSCGLLYGKNAVGKTNFCNALMDIRTIVWGYQPSASEYETYLNADRTIESASFSYEFELGGSTVEYAYSKEHPCCLTRETLKVDSVILFDYDFRAGRLLEGDLSEVGAASLELDGLNSSLPVLRYVCNNSPRKALGVLGALYDFAGAMSFIQDKQYFTSSLDRVVARVIERGLVENLEEFLQSFGIDERLVVRTSPAGERVLYFKKERLIPFVDYCSSGTRALVRVFEALKLGKKTSFLFIDEFDAFYHHDLAESLIDFFKSVDAQVIAATHNTDLFSNKVLRPDCLFILSRSGIASAANATERELREGHNLEKLYKAGEFDV